MDPLSTLTIGVLLQKYAGPFLKDYVLPVLENILEGRIQDKFFPNTIQRKVKQHLDKAIDKAFPYKDFTTEPICEKERKLAINNLKSYLFGDDSLELTSAQQDILNEWVKRLLNDPDCFQLVEALKNEGRYSTMLQIVDSFPDRVVKPIEKLFEDKDKVDAGWHSETMARFDQLEEKVNAGAKTESKVDENELIEQIIKKFKETRDSHPSMLLTEISEKLFPEGVTTKKNFNEEDECSGKIQSVGEILNDSWKQENNHIMILGEGGIGKTVTLLNIPSWFSEQQGSIQIPAIYIPLYKLNSSGPDPIAEFIKNHILNRSLAKLDALYNILGKPWDRKPRLLLLVDGFNEIPKKERPRIGGNIDDWAQLSGIQIITSSRVDATNSFFNGKKYYKVELKPLTQGAVVQYMEKAGYSYPDDPTIGRLISTPLLLNLYLETRKVIDRRQQNIEESSLLFKEDNTAGAIIWNYLQCEVWNAVNQSHDDDSSVNACIVATEFVIPYLAKKMHDSADPAILSEADFDETLVSVISKLKESGNGYFPMRIRNSWEKAAFSATDTKNELADLLTKRLHFLVYRGNGFGFMHQDFRDAFVALLFINVSYMVSDNTLPEDWQTPIDFEVMNYVAQIATKEDADRLWEQNRCSGTKSDVSTINMLELQKRKRNYDFSELNFLRLDLSRVSLLPYREPGSINLHFPHKPSLIKDLRVSKKSFCPNGYTNRLTCLAITPDGKRGVSGSADGALHFWDFEYGQCLRALGRHNGGISSLAITPDGKRCVSGSYDRTLRVWDTESGRCLWIRDRLTSVITFLSITHDGRRWISKSLDEFFRGWYIESEQCLWKRHWHVGGITSLTIIPRSERCISVSFGRTLHVLDIESGQFLGTLPGHTDWINALSFTSDGKICVSGSADGAIRVWDIESGQCLKPLDGHTRGITSLAITSDGKRCVSGSTDGAILVWDIESGQCLKPLVGHSSRITSLSIAPDGKRCVSGSADGTLCVWDIESEYFSPLDGFGDNVVLTSDGKKCIHHAEDTIQIRTLEDLNLYTDITIHVLPIYLDGVNFAQADVPEDLKKTLWQNGASFKAAEKRAKTNQHRPRSYEEVFTPEEARKMGIGGHIDGPGDWKPDPNTAQKAREFIEKGGNADPELDAIQDGDYHDLLDQMGGPEGF